jgi:uncharacterized hydrophobic protein (TIGR00271 family)
MPPMTDSPAEDQRRRDRVRAALTGRAGIRALLSAGIVLVAVLFPVFATRVLFEAAAVALIVIGGHGAVVSMRAQPRRWGETARDLLAAVAGIAMLGLQFMGNGRLVVLALALILAGRGTIQLVALVTRSDQRREAWHYVAPLGQIAVAGLIVVVPESLSAIALALALFWIISGAINLQRALSDPNAEPAGLAETGTAILDYLRNQDVGRETRTEVEQALFFEDGDGGSEKASVSRVWRFVALMSFSTAIATFGITGDSTAVVIGAMLVAPLMTPILGVSASIVSGWSTRLGRSFAIVSLGIGIAVSLSFLLSRYVGGFIDVAHNTQIASRVAPTLVDLAIAVAAGAAGAYANARRDVSDSLPGVAIAVALVPPLSVVGVTLQEGEGGMALGAFLLFSTNLVGIILAAAITFFLLGLTPWFRVRTEASSIMRSFAVTAVALVAIAIPLALSGEELLTSATNQQAVAAIVDEVAAETDYEVVSIEQGSGRVEIIATGPSDAPPPDLEALAVLLDGLTGGDYSLVVRVIPEDVYELDVTSGDD